MNNPPFNDLLNSNPMRHLAPLGSEPEDTEAIQCNICFGSLDRGVALFPCTHIYHEACIDTWLKDSSHPHRGCPTCKRKVTCYLNPEELPLHMAAAKGQSDIVNGLLELDANVAASNEVGLTALHCAASNGNEAIIKRLVKHGANVNALTTTARGAQSPLHLAMLNSHEAAMLALIDSGADINHPSPDGPPLHVAVEKGFLNVIEVLLDKGTDINAFGMWTPLHYAVAHGQHGVISLLLKGGADINAQWSLVPAERLLKKRNTMVESDQSAGQDGRQNPSTILGETPLHMAIDKGQAETVDLLLSAGAATNVLINRGETLWCWANRNNDLTAPIIRSLASGICRVRAPCDNLRAGLLGALIKLSDWDLFDQLRANTQDVDINKIPYPDSDKSAFYEVVKEGQTDKIRAMTNRGADINARDQRGETLLHYAVTSSAVTSSAQDTIKVLLACMADVNAKNNEGETPLHLAAKSGKSEIIDQLIDHGAFVDATTGRSVDTASGAVVKDCQATGGNVQSSHSGAVALAKINLSGMTPLHYAVHKGHLTAVQHLLDRGASIHHKNQIGETPLELAESDLKSARAINACVLWKRAAAAVKPKVASSLAERKPHKPPYWIKTYSEIIALLKTWNAQPQATPEPSVSKKITVQ